MFQGSELSGWGLGRYTVEGIDLNHNFPDLNNILWNAQEEAPDKSRVPNHYVPIPEYYTKEEAMVGSGFESPMSTHGLPAQEEESWKCVCVCVCVCVLTGQKNKH